MTERDFLPETPEQITPAWLGEALDIEVKAINQQVLGADVGFMGDVLLLDIDSPQPSAPRRLIAKLPKLENRVVGELLGVYEREIMFLRAFGDVLPVRVPRLYYSEFDRDVGSENQKPIIRALDKFPGFLNGAIGWAAMRAAGAKNRRYLLLLEYFDDMQPGDQLAGLDVGTCAVVLKQIARWHAQFWADPQLGDHFWLMEFDIDARMRQGTLRRHRHDYGKVLGPQLAGHLDWLCKHTAALVRAFCADVPPTLLHADLRLDNVIFDGDSCALIDFQLSRSGPAAYDVAYFISSALPEDVSEADHEALLRQYHMALAIPDYGFDNFLRDYRRALLIVLATLSGNDEVQLGEGRGGAMMAAWLRRLSARVAPLTPADLLQ